MCGRYASGRDPRDLQLAFDADEVVPPRNTPAAPDRTAPPETAPAPPRLDPDWNVAPTKDVYAVLERIPRDRSEAPPVRRLRPVRWGLVPSWAQDPKVGSSMINARLETVQTKPAFRRALALRRCLLPADGWYEWYRDGSGPTVPHFISRRDGQVLAMAGLYELWLAPGRPPQDPASWLWTCTIITTSALDELGHLHERMPVLIPRRDYGRWLDPRRRDPAAARELLVPTPPGLLTSHPVSREVGNHRNNGPHLVAPAPLPAGDRATLPT